MKKKKLCIILLPVLLLIVFLILALTGVIPLFSKERNEEEIEGSLAWGYKMVRDHKIDIIIRGEDVPFEYEAHYRKVDRLDADTIHAGAKGSSPFIVIVDREGRLELTQEEIDFVEVCITDRRIPMLYIGTQYGDAWKMPDQTGSYQDVVGNTCIEYTWEKGMPFTTVGFWGAGEEEAYKIRKEILGDVIISSIRLYIERNT